MRFSAFVVSALLGASVLPAVAEPLHISDAWIREPIPGRQMSAAFMQLHNAGSADKVLVSASADWAGTIELHTHTNDNGVMRMRQVPDMTVAAGQALSLQPGGLHLMLFNLTLPLPDAPQLTLCFRDGECQTVTARVRGMDSAPMPMGPGHQHH